MMGLAPSTAGAFRCNAPGAVAVRPKAIRRAVNGLLPASAGSATTRAQHCWPEAARGRMLVADVMGCDPSRRISWREAEDGARDGGPWRDPRSESRQSLALR